MLRGAEGGDWRYVDTNWEEMKWGLLEGMVEVWGWEEKCERKNSFFKYYNIKFFESQERWEEWGW